MSRRAIVALAGAALLTACGQNAESAESVKDLMAKRIQPTAEIYWESVQYISDEQGNHDIVPTSDEEWDRTRKSAADISEFGRLLTTPAYSEGRGEDWEQFAQALIDVGKKAEEAALHKSPDEVFEVGGTIYNVCSACHQAYPAESPDPAASGAGENA